MTGPSLLPFRPRMVCAWRRPAPDLFPAMYLVKMQYTRNETKGRGAFGRSGEQGHKPLKSNRIISLTICPLN